MSLSACVASFCSSVGFVVTPPAVSISVSGVTSNRERFVWIDGSVPIEHRVLHVETHHCCTKATASCELNFFSLEKTWVLFCAVRLRAEQRNVHDILHKARAGAAVVGGSSQFRGCGSNPCSLQWAWLSAVREERRARSARLVHTVS